MSVPRHRKATTEDRHKIFCGCWREILQAYGIIRICLVTPLSSTQYLFSC